MNIERLQAQIKVLERVIERDRSQPKHSHFNMLYWAEDLDENDNPICATSACALGWMALSEEGREGGLRMVNGVPSYPDTTTDGAYDAIGYWAAALFFDIGQAEAEWLFSSLSYGKKLATPYDVICRIEILIEEAKRSSRETT